MNVYCVIGYPGAGKSAVEAIASELGYTTVQMGNRVKERAYQELGEGADSDSIGEWATRKREEQGDTVVAEWTLEYLTETETTEIVVIDGVRSMEELQIFKSEFDTVTPIFVTAPIEVRLRRLQQRGRDGEEGFTKEDLVERDEREDSWGVAKLIEETDPVQIENTGSFRDLEEEVAVILNHRNN